MATVESRLDLLAPEVQRVSQRQDGMVTDMTTLRDMIQGLSVELQVVNGKLGEAITTQNEHLKDFENSVSKIVVSQKLGLENTVKEATFTFNEQRKSLEENRVALELLHSRSSEEFSKAKIEIQDVQSQSSAAWSVHESRLNSMYVEASGGWQVHEANINSLTEGVKAIVEELKVKVEKIEAGGGGHVATADS